VRRAAEYADKRCAAECIERFRRNVAEVLEKDASRAPNREVALRIRVLIIATQ
jgi:hypothetical protein